MTSIFSCLLKRHTAIHMGGWTPPWESVSIYSSWGLRALGWGMRGTRKQLEANTGLRSIWLPPRNIPPGRICREKSDFMGPLWGHTRGTESIS